jgi:hypothetical protein
MGKLIQDCNTGLLIIRFHPTESKLMLISNSRITDEWGIGKDLTGSGACIINHIRISLEGTRNSTKVLRVAGFRTEIRTEYLPIRGQNFTATRLEFNYVSIHLWLYSTLLDLGCFFSFLIIFTVGRTIWTGDQPVAKPLPTHRTTQTQNKRKQTSMLWVGFEPTTPAFEWAKTVHALDGAATVIGSLTNYREHNSVWETISCLVSQEIPKIFMIFEDPLQCR